MKDDEKNNDKSIKNIGSKKDSEKKDIILEKYSENKEELYAEKAVEEMNSIKEAFIEFQSTVSTLACWPYMEPTVEQFAIYASSLTTLLEDGVPKLSTLEEETKAVELNKLRDKMLTSIKKKYFE